MSKLKTERISATDLSEYLNSHSDFSFELSVLKMLREANVECEHGGHYQDPVTNKSREFDIRAIKTIDRLRVRMAIECKNIGENFPILISCIPRHEQDSYHQIALLSEPGEQSHLTSPVFQSRAEVINIRGNHSLYKPGEPVGKSTVQVGRHDNKEGEISANDSGLYEKWGQCLSSADDLVGHTYYDGKDDEMPCLSTVIPFVVVPNGRLWIATYDNDGELISGPEPTNRCSCFIGRDYEMDKLAGAQMTLSHVEIVTFDGMRTFVEDHLKSREDMVKIFPREAVFESTT